MDDDRDVSLKQIILSQFVNDNVENPDRHWTEKYTQKDIDDLKAYLMGHNISIPEIPEDGRKNDVVKIMVRTWAAIETLNYMGHIIGFDNPGTPQKLTKSRFSDIDVIMESEIKKKKTQVKTNGKTEKNLTRTKVL
jgi:hypothetical protein